MVFCDCSHDGRDLAASGIRKLGCGNRVISPTFYELRRTRLLARLRLVLLGLPDHLRDQTRSDPVPFGQRWGHLAEKAVDSGGELRMALPDENGARGQPTLFNHPAGLNEPRLTGFRTEVTFEELGGYRLSAGTRVDGVTAGGGAVDAVCLMRV